MSVFLATCASATAASTRRDRTAASADPVTRSTSSPSCVKVLKKSKNKGREEEENLGIASITGSMDVCLFMMIHHLLPVFFRC